MASQTEIVNESLILVGAIQINSIDDTSRRARDVKTLLNTSKRAVLRMIPWHFAREYVLLTPTLDDKYISDFPYISRKPADCIRALQVYIPRSQTGPASLNNEQIPMPRWKSVGNYIGMIFEEGDLNYTRDTPEGQFDDLAANLLSAYLATKLAISLRSSNTIKKDNQDLFLMLKKEAANANGLEGLRDSFRTVGRLTQVRRARAGTVAGR